MTTAQLVLPPTTPTGRSPTVLTSPAPSCPGALLRYLHTLRLFSLPHLIDGAQAVGELKKLYGKSDYTSFFETFKAVTNHVLVVFKREAAVERCIDTIVRCDPAPSVSTSTPSLPARPRPWTAGLLERPVHILYSPPLASVFVTSPAGALGSPIRPNRTNSIISPASDPAPAPAPAKLTPFPQNRNPVQVHRRRLGR